MRSALLIFSAVILLLLIAPYFGLSFSTSSRSTASQNHTESRRTESSNTKTSPQSVGQPQTTNNIEHKQLQEIEVILKQEADGKDK